MTEPTRDVPTVEVRRNLLWLVAEGDFEGLTKMGDELHIDWRDYVMQAIACELIAVSRQLEEAAMPALAVAGTILGGLLGVGPHNGADDDARSFNAAGSRARAEFLRETVVSVSA